MIDVIDIGAHVVHVGADAGAVGPVAGAAPEPEVFEPLDDAVIVVVAGEVQGALLEAPGLAPRGEEAGGGHGGVREDGARGLGRARRRQVHAKGGRRRRRQGRGRHCNAVC